MSGSDNKVPVERRASMRTSMRLSMAPGEEDDYDMQMMGISDGFRPTDATPDHVSNSPLPALPIPAAATYVQAPRPSSIAKPPQPRASFSLRHDGNMGSMADSIVAGSSSNARQSPLARSESPYQGPSGPSFPYQMYNQDVRSARTASLATTATVPAEERTYNGPSNPTHPYQMYPQNTVAATEVSEETISPVHPVGFNGAGDDYQRRIGSEGEEVADMIGPDGHTEQLPPYTRYPDEAYQRKIAGIGGLSTIESSGASASSAATTIAAAATTRATSTTPSTASTTQMQAVPGAGGIGLATRDPEYASSDYLPLQGAVVPNSPQSRHSFRSFNSDGSHHDINTAARTVLDEKKPLKKWQVVAKRKVWGVVPCWALTLTIIIVVMLGAVLGAVLGVVLNKPKKPPPSDSNSSATMTYDASPLATIPPDLTPLPSGDFALPLMLARSPTTCFNDSTQAQAWNCNQVFAQLQLNINQLSSTPSTSQYAMSLSYNSSFTMDNYEYSYGMQPPKVDDVKMLLVTDINEPSRGPAWAFEVAYNKTVIIPENLFPAPSSSSSSKSKRRGGPPPPPDGISFPGVGGGDFKRKGLAQSGDKPWICHWDGTILEVFVYPNQNNSQPSIIYSGSSSASSTSSGSITAAVAAVTSTSATSDATSTASTTASSEWEFTDHKNAYVTTRHDRRQVTSSTATPTTETSATGTASSSGVFDTSMPKPSDFMVPFFPRVVKMEERRLSGEPSVQPYCRQYQINGNGVAATPIKDSNGKFIEVQIVELEPDGNSEHQRKENQKGRYVVRRDIDNFLNHGVAARNSDSDMSDCGCMWWAT